MNEFPTLRFHTHKPAPHDAGPTPPRRDGAAKKLARRISHWDSTQKLAVHTHHKPGSFK